MRKKLLFTVCVAMSGLAMASPAITAKQAGSSILFNVVNSEAREYGCSLTWSATWNNFGKAGGDTLNRTVVVRAKQNGLLMQDNTTYSNFRLTGFSYTCT